MFQRMIEDFKDSTGTALRLTSLAAAAMLALFAVPLSLLGYYLSMARGKASYNFPSDEHEREHYDTLHNSHFRDLHGADAEDVASETWLQVARDISSFSGDWDKFRGWAVTIARHRRRSTLSRIARPRGAPSGGSGPAPSASRSTRLCPSAGPKIVAMREMCELNVLSDCSRLCSSPMSAQTSPTTPISEPGSAGMCRPASAISVSKPTVFNATVLPPVLGPASPSRARLWSRAGGSATTASPSTRAWSVASSPTSSSPKSTRPLFAGAVISLLCAFVAARSLPGSDWTAQWITPDLSEDTTRANPSPLLRRVFTLGSGIAYARLYVTSLGLNIVELNGQRVTDHLFRPGWTSYDKRLQYDTYDVTPLLRSGTNAIGVMLGDGWYRGHIGFQGSRNNYGKRRGRLTQLVVRFSDGHVQVVGSDREWKSSTGAIVMSDIYDGEIYDSRLEKPGWSRAGFDDKSWSGVRSLDGVTAALRCTACARRRVSVIAPDWVVFNS